ncbi:MAG TPA: tetratricopeptide repeat protein [Candidatus Omnitrophota bacterium]|nr:tetratricopeptide repeat protein [Candidatus Omnitrophota bacterium]HQL40883.1 tetratricopeptide repeat protein [Candidatus Omnitrophota bacterium]
MKRLSHQLSFLKKFYQPIAIICIAIVTFITFAPSLKGELLHWDDNVHLTENRFVRGLSPQYLKEIFTQRVNNTYHPLTTLSFAIEYYFVGYRPFLYHLNNLLLHIGVAILIYFFLRQLHFSITIAAVATLFFSLHPTRVESIAWVTERKDVLYAFFYMLGLLSYIRYRKAQDGRFYWLSAFLFLLSILSKAMALSFPLILLLLDWYQGRKIDKRTLLEKVPLFLIAIIVAGATYMKFARIPIYNHYEALMIWPWTLAFYICKFFYPDILIPVYDIAYPVSILNPEYFLSFLIVFALILCLIFGRRHRWFIFSFGFFFLSIFFLLRLDYGFDSQPVADRFLYLPSLGFSIGLAFAVTKILELKIGAQKVLRCALGIFAVCILIAFGVIAHLQCHIWKNDDTLWSHQAMYSVSNPISTNNLSLSFEVGFRKDIFEKDVAVLKEKIAQDPEYVETLKKRSRFRSLKEIIDVHSLAERRFLLLHKALSGQNVICEPIVNLADLYARIGFPEIAIDYYYWAQSENPDYMKAHYDLAHLYADLGRDKESIDKYWQALRFRKMDSLECGKVIGDLNEIIEKRRKKGEDASAFVREREILYVYLRDLTLQGAQETMDAYALAIAYENIRDWDAAANAYTKAIKEDPQDLERVLALGNIYLQKGSYDMAIRAYEQVLERDPKNEKAYLNLGVVFDHLRQYERSVEYYQHVLSLSEDRALAYCNLGHAYQSLGKYNDAIEAYQKAAEIKPDYDTVYYDMGNVWLKLKDIAKAQEAYQKVLEINPRHANALMNLSIVLFYQKKFQEAKDLCQRAQNLGVRPPKRYLQALKYYLENPDAP